MPVYETPRNDPDLAMEHTKIVASIKCLERRFGESMMPYQITRRDRQGPIKVLDVETGSWVRTDISGWRVRVLEESDGC